MRACFDTSSFHHRLRMLAFSAILLLALLLVLSHAAHADHLDREIQFDIPAQPMSSALVQFAKQADVQLITASLELGKLNSRGVSGKLAARRALEKVLDGSGLTYSLVGKNTVAISLNRVAQRETSVSSDNSSAGAETPSSGSYGAEIAGLGEIIVTAEKREERLQDVPVSVSSINVDTLVNTDQVRLQDYYTEVPGLSVTSQGFRDAPILSIRGIATGTGSNPTVGITVDDVPYGASTNLGGGTLAPDIDPGDLDHIEVLRGPQGTLYGADSMGGLIKYVTVDPSTDALTGRIESGISGVYAGAEPGYQVRGSANIPLSDSLAIRVSAFSRQDPGYISDPALYLKGVNEASDAGGRVAALWKPSDVLSVKISALVQDYKSDGSPLIFPALGDLQQNDARGTGWSDKRIQAYSATFDAKLGPIDLTAITGYSINQFNDDIDFTQLLGTYSQTPFAVSGWAIPERNKTDKFTQELRLSSSIGDKFHWLLGAFYNHETTDYAQNNIAINPATGTPAGEWGTNSFPSTFTEYATFADLTFQIADPFDVQVGARESRFMQTYSETIAGTNYTELFYGSPVPLIQPEQSDTADAFTYLLTPRFKISPDLMLYARFASGYRPGAINLGNTLFDLPLISKPDKTQSYELGTKGDVLNHALSFDVSLYHIDWKDIQLTIIDPRTGDSIYVNGGRAKSQGAELSVESRPISGLRAAAWVAWNDAQLTQAIPPGGPGSVVGTDGDRLPYSSRFSANVSLEQDFSIGNTNPFVGGSVSYVGQREGEFTPTSERQGLPAYATTNLRAGVKYRSWSYNLFIDNAFDRRGVLSGGLGTYVPNAFTYIRPRTIGLNAIAHF